jgi:hypothetical protein
MPPGPRFARALIPTILLLAPAALPAQEGPSFNCRYARTASEIAICASPELSRIERRMVEAYEVLVGEIGRTAARRIADEHLARREACGSDPTCIATRLSISREAFLQLAGVEPPPAVQPTVQAAAPPPAAPPAPPPAPVALPPAWSAPAPGGTLAPLPPGGIEAGAPTVARPAPPPEAAPAPDLASVSTLGHRFMALPDWRRRNLQGRLQEAGFHDGPVDGLWDAATEAALTAFVLDASDRGVALDPRTQAGADEVLAFVDGDAFKREWLEEPVPEVAFDW